MEITQELLNSKREKLKAVESRLGSLQNDNISNELQSEIPQLLQQIAEGYEILEQLEAKLEKQSTDTKGELNTDKIKDTIENALSALEIEVESVKKEMEQFIAKISI